jgi:thiamine pyrophosphokinase
VKRKHLHVTSALLLCNGEPPGRPIAEKVARYTGLVVAADGGANSARALGLSPHVIIGDLDSVKPSTLRSFRSATVVRVRRQDNTDMEKALDYLRDQGVRRVYLLGATGKRLDMTLANLTVLWHYVPPMEIIVVGTGWYAIPVDGNCRITAPRGTIVSLIPYGPCSGVTLAGLKYPLNDASWKLGDIAVSNVVKRSAFSVSIRKGRALMVVFSNFPILNSELRAQNSGFPGGTSHPRRSR